MKRIICSTLVIGFMLLLASASFARPRGEVKASPLYQQSLQQSIAQIEGKVLVSAGSNRTGAAGLPTSSSVCPAVPYTQQYTCTQQVGCTPTQGGQYTCAVTCGNTCANTCANTCVGGPCTNYSFNGYVDGYDIFGEEVDWTLPWGWGEFDSYWVQYGFGGYVDAQFDSASFPAILSYAEFDGYGHYNFSKVGNTWASSYAVAAQVYVSNGYSGGYYPGDTYVNQPPSSTSSNYVWVGIYSLPY